MKNWILYWNATIIHCFKDGQPVSLCNRVRRTSWVDESKVEDEKSCSACMAKARLIQ